MNISALNKQAFCASMLLLFTPFAFAQQKQKMPNFYFSGAINSDLPSIGIAGAAPAISFPKMGKIAFGTEALLCGDGDVANFAASHQDYLFYPAAANVTPMVFGYWITPGGGSDYPANSTWYSIGYLDDLPIAGASQSDLKRTNSAGPKEDALKLMQEVTNEMVQISKATKSVNVASTQYSLRFAAMACPQLQIKDGVNADGGISSKLTLQLMTGQGIMLKDGNVTDLTDSLSAIVANGSNAASLKSALDSAQLDHLTVNVVDAGRSSGLRVSLGGGISNDLAGTMSEISNILAAKPDFSRAASVGDQIADMASPGTDCNLGGISLAGGQMTWEPFQTKSVCQFAAKMAQDQLDTYRAALSGMKAAFHDAKPDDPSPADIFVFQKTMVQSAVLARIAPLILHTAEKELASKISSGKLALNKISCIPASNSSPYISKITSSIYVVVNKDTSAGGAPNVQNLKVMPPGSPAHPEPFFAIGGYASYAGAAGNHYTVYNNHDVTNQESVLTPGPSGASQSNIIFRTGGANFSFRLRSIGCAGPTYCSNSF